MMKPLRITFKDLSWPVKTAVVAAWAIGIMYVGAFLIGFIIGLITY